LRKRGTPIVRLFRRDRADRGWLLAEVGSRQPPTHCCAALAKFIFCFIVIVPGRLLHLTRKYSKLVIPGRPHSSPVFFLRDDKHGRRNSTGSQAFPSQFPRPQLPKPTKVLSRDHHKLNFASGTCTARMLWTTSRRSSLATIFSQPPTSTLGTIPPLTIAGVPVTVPFLFPPKFPRLPWDLLYPVHMPCRSCSRSQVFLAMFSRLANAEVPPVIAVESRPPYLSNRARGLPF